MTNRRASRSARSRRSATTFVAGLRPGSSRTSISPERPRNCLKRAQVNTVGELLQKSEDDLLAITNFGQKSLDEVLVKLDERGLSLRGRN